MKKNKLRKKIRAVRQMTAERGEERPVARKPVAALHTYYDTGLGAKDSPTTHDIHFDRDQAGRAVVPDTHVKDILLKTVKEQTADAKFIKKYEFVAHAVDMRVLKVTTFSKEIMGKKMWKATYINGKLTE